MKNLKTRVTPQYMEQGKVKPNRTTYEKYIASPFQRQLGYYTTTASDLQGAAIVKSGLPALVKRNLHYQTLKEKQLKDTRWTEAVFESIDWCNYQHAIKSLPRTTKISRTKLSYNLWNTNVQNAKYYGQSDNCPWCKESESIDHISWCKSEGATAVQREALFQFSEQLHKAKTPPPILQIILDGVQVCTPKTSSKSRNQEEQPHAAVREQRESIGWTRFLQGYISKKWKQWFTILNLGGKQKNGAETWVKNVIIQTLEYSQKI